MKKVVLIHYGEIGTKGENREYFERLLMKNIECQTGKKVRRRYGKLVLEDYDYSLEKMLKHIPGIENFSFSYSCDTDLEEIKKCVYEILKDMNFETFKISAKRSYKDFPLTSLELNKVLGSFVVEKFGKKVDLKNSDVVVFVEVSEKESFVYTEKIKGVGGIPVGSNGKGLALLSGGIDSPVASFLMMKRGLEVSFIHFYRDHIKPEKIFKIVNVLSNFQPYTVLFLVPSNFIQKKIVESVPENYRMLVYKWLMIKIAEELSKKEGYKALILGDSLGQVASQTLDNINCLYNTEIPLLSPLIGFNKSEIVEISKNIGTYELSIIPYEDCCSLIASKHPVTRCKKEYFEKVVEKLDIEGIIRDALEKTEKFIYDNCLKNSSSRRGNA